MRIEELQNGQVVRARWGRYREDMDHPDWGPWQNVTLYVQRNLHGHVAIVALAGGQLAEYAPRWPKDKRAPGIWDVGEGGEHAQGVLEAEGYYLQIDGLTR